MDKTERKICLYCAILITIVLSCTRLLALRENGILAHYWRFNLTEFLFQMFYCLSFTWWFLFSNVHYNFWVPAQRRRYVLYACYYTLIVLLAAAFGGAIQWNVFSDRQQRFDLFWSAYLIRFVIDAALTGIAIKIILLMRESRQKSLENAELKSAYLEAELEVLKGQLDPHFLFNSLSSLSAIIREDTRLAQHYLSQLSKVLRNSLQRSGASLISVEEELTTAKAYGQLLTMRFENAFQLVIDVDERYWRCKIPHLSVQLLIENAAKHNLVTLKKPLKVEVSAFGDYLTVSNNLQETERHENGSGIGLANLNGRFKILMDKEIVITKTDTSFSVKLPFVFEK